MWYSGSTCQKIGALVKASHKRLKSVLASGVRKLSLASVVSKLGEFPFFDYFFDFSPFDFFDLNNFRDLADFWYFNFPDFLACSISLPSNWSTSLLSLFLPKASLLLLFLLEADLLLLFLLGAGSSGYSVVFNIEISETAILLKP